MRHKGNLGESHGGWGRNILCRQNLHGKSYWEKGREWRNEGREGSEWKTERHREKNRETEKNQERQKLACLFKRTSRKRESRQSLSFKGTFQSCTESGYWMPCAEVSPRGGVKVCLDTNSKHCRRSRTIKKLHPNLKQITAKQTEGMMRLCTLNGHPQWHTSSIKATTTNSTQRVLPTGMNYSNVWVYVGHCLFQALNSTPCHIWFMTISWWKMHLLKFTSFCSP